jgi:hypothetical protein
VRESFRPTVGVATISTAETLIVGAAPAVGEIAAPEAVFAETAEGVGGVEGFVAAAIVTIVDGNQLWHSQIPASKRYLHLYEQQEALVSAPWNGT